MLGRELYSSKIGKHDKSATDLGVEFVQVHSVGVREP